MATVEKRQQSPGGPIRYRVRWRDPAGKQKSLTFDKARDARAWAATVEANILTGAYIDPRAGRITLRTYAEKWRKARVWAPSTAERVESVFRLHLYPVLGDHPVGSILPSDVQAWVAGMVKAGLSPASVRVAGANLSGVLRSAVRDRLIASNPCSEVELPRAPKVEVVPPTIEQVRLLAEEVADERRALVVVGAGLGLRVSEALGLTVDRIDFLRRTVRVDRQIVDEKGSGPKLSPLLKSDASVRTLPLPDTVATVLAEHLRRHGSGVDGVIFHTRGRPMRRGYVADVLVAARRRLNEAAEADDLELPFPGRFRFHDLRHFYASMLIASGASVKTVQKRLGHASAVETLDTYGHLWPDAEEQTRSAVDDVLGSPVAWLWPVAAE